MRFLYPKGLNFTTFKILCKVKILWDSSICPFYDSVIQTFIQQICNKYMFIHSVHTLCAWAAVLGAELEKWTGNGLEGGWGKGGSKGNCNLTVEFCNERRVTLVCR